MLTCSVLAQRMLSPSYVSKVSLSRLTFSSKHPSVVVDPEAVFRQSASSAARGFSYSVEKWGFWLF